MTKGHEHRIFVFPRDAFVGLRGAHAVGPTFQQRRS